VGYSRGLLPWVPQKLDLDIMKMEDQYESGNRQHTLIDKIVEYTKILSDTKKLADIFTKYILGISDSTEINKSARC
jgi:hypothetical protein